jgi:hypothetical protein
VRKRWFSVVLTPSSDIGMELIPTSPLDVQSYGWAAESMVLSKEQ